MPEWNVYIEDFNGQCIRKFNIFRHHGFREDCAKAARKRGTDFEAFAATVRQSLMYFFWSKCEYEIILGGWPEKPSFREEKVDVYDQVMLNWDVFIRWLWDNRKALKEAP